MDADTMRHSSMIPCMRWPIDSLAFPTSFLALEAKWDVGRLQLKSLKKTRPRCAFCQGLFRLFWMPEGFAMYQGPFNRQWILPSTEKWYFVFVYFDDIFILFRTPEQHFDHVQIVVKLWWDTDVKVELRTCDSFTSSINTLGTISAPVDCTLLLTYPTQHTTWNSRQPSQNVCQS